MNKKIRRLFLSFFLISISSLFHSCMYSPHYVCTITSEDNIYSKISTGKIAELKKYSFNENVFVAVPEVSSLSTDSKNRTASRIVFEVYSKSENYSYTIDEFSIIFDGQKHNVNEYVTMYYPYEKETYIEFSKSRVNPEYYRSAYFVGFIEFPTPKNKKFQYEVTISDNDSNQFTFVYNYSVKLNFNLFIMYA